MRYFLVLHLAYTIFVAVIAFYFLDITRNTAEYMERKVQTYAEEAEMRACEHFNSIDEVSVPYTADVQCEWPEDPEWP